MSLTTSPVGKATSRKKQSRPFIIYLIVITSSCTSSLFLFLWSLIHGGPTFYNGQECQMTYSRYQFLPLRVLPFPSSSSRETKRTANDSLSRDVAFRRESITAEKYRLLKFTDGRDPRHRHLHPVSGTMMEVYGSESKKKYGPRERDLESGRLLELYDNWCLLPHPPPEHSKKDLLNRQWRNAPYPHQGHLVLFVPGHWGSFSQARSLGAHGTRWTGPYERRETDRQIFQAFLTGEGMHEGFLSVAHNDVRSIVASERKSLFYNSIINDIEKHLEGFVMDVFSLDFDGEGAALHSSKLLRQALFFARSILTIGKACYLPDQNEPPRNASNDGEKIRNSGITIVAHSIGAFVVRIALRMYPQLTSQGYIRNIITLASPLGGVPYAVDAGIHEISEYLNDLDSDCGEDGKWIDEDVRENGRKITSQTDSSTGRKRRINIDEGDVALISISGGLKDEMIPPENCQFPPPGNSRDDRRYAYTKAKDKKGARAAILSTSITKFSNTLEGSFGMDHRAIVWCHDLLEQVRKAIHAMVIATHLEIDAKERIQLAQAVLNQDKLESGTSNASTDNVSFAKDVVSQRKQFLNAKGYMKAVIVQLAAPYHLNSLFKLSILAALLYPVTSKVQTKGIKSKRTKHRYRFKTENDDSTIQLFVRNLASGMLFIPCVVALLTMLRQCHWNFTDPSCDKHECHLLLGTVYVLGQLATMAYLLILYGVSPLAALAVDVCKRELYGSVSNGKIILERSFTVTFLKCCFEQSHTYILFNPLMIATVFFICDLAFGDIRDRVWNTLSIASYCFLSIIAFVMTLLIKLACCPTNASTSFSPQTQGFGQNFSVNAINDTHLLVRSTAIVILLSLIKASFSKVIYAYSMTTHEGQLGFEHHSAFLKDVHSYRGKLGVHHDEMIIFFMTNLIPILMMVMAVKSYVICSENWIQFWEKRQEKNDLHWNDPDQSLSELEYLWDNYNLLYEEPIILKIAKLLLIGWYAWNIFLCRAHDDMVIPLYSIFSFASFYFRFVWVSSTGFDVFSVFIENDLFLHCDSSHDHGKRE